MFKIQTLNYVPLNTSALLNFNTSNWNSDQENISKTYNGWEIAYDHDV